MKKTNARWNIFFMLAIICTINYIDRAVISVCMPQIQEELKFSPEVVGAILSAFLGICIDANSLWMALR